MPLRFNTMQAATKPVYFFVLIARTLFRERCIAQAITFAPQADKVPPIAASTMP